MPNPGPSGLVFGIFPGMTGEETPVRLPWDPERTAQALDGLQPAGRQLILRAYLQYHGQGQSSHHVPSDMLRYLAPGRAIELVLQYRAPSYDAGDWQAFIRAILARWGEHLAAIQVGEEPNSVREDGDGGFPEVRRAVVEGVLAAREEALRRGLRTAVGCNSTPIIGPADDYWAALCRLGGAAFTQALAYVGLDFFPDVFRPIPFEALKGAVAFVLGAMRGQYTAAGIPTSTPLRIGENSWPTGSTRSPERQAEVLDKIVRSIYARRGELNISHYQFFGLRDPDSTLDNLTQWGLLRDDYTPKPAYAVYRRLIEELGV